MKLKGRLMNIIMSAMLVAGSIAVPAAPAAAAANTLPAFPGAEGGGKYATGGRGGQIVHVTNLNDSGSGSFRDAVSSGHRIVVFDVGGTINLKSDVSVAGNVTILGQTAPGGGGITLKGAKIGMGGDNMIIRYLSSRPGETGKECDAWGGSKGSNSIVDHCSLGWANDEQWGLYSNNTHQTVQYTLIGPSNCISVHDKGCHGFGVMFGSNQNSWHHNMIAHNVSRNFRGKVGGTNTMDFVNNVIFDWGYQTGYGTLGHLNYVNNYLKGGLSTTGGWHFMKADGSARENYKFYLTGNKIMKHDGTAYNQAMNDNNWSGGIQYTTVEGYTYSEKDYRTDTPFKVEDVNGNDASVLNSNQFETADEAFETVINYAGAGISPDKRPKIDQQVMEEARTGNGYLTGGPMYSTTTSSALLKAIKDYNIKEMNYEEYYPPQYTTLDRTDADKDGMDDNWELERGLNPNDPSDAAGDYYGQGYMNIEYYANDLTINSFPEGIVTESPKTADLGEDYKMVMEDANALKLSPTTIKTAEDLTLPATGSINGSTIKWSSASSEVKISNNKITEVKRPSDKDASVILSAEITHGTFTLKRSYTITVKSTAANWVASEGDNGKKAGSELIDGLTVLGDTTGGTTNVTLNDKTYSYYISGQAGGGKWKDGKVENCTGFKYTPENSGYLNVYIASLGQAAKEDGTPANPKTAYIMEEGAASEEDNIATATGAGENTVMTGRVEAGHTYYIYVAGSNGRFLAINITNEAPTLIWKATKDVKKGETLMSGLTANDNMTFGATNRTIDSVAFTGRLTGDNAPADGGASGMALTYTPKTKGVITVYYKLNSGKRFVIHEPGKTADEELTMYKTNSDAANIYTSTSANLEAGKTYYIYVEGSKTEFYGVSFRSTEGEPDPDIKPDAPDPTMPPLVGETWNFDDIDAGTEYGNGDMIANGNDVEIKVNYATGNDDNVPDIAVAPSIAEKTAGSSDHYLKIDDKGKGQDGWSYTPETPVESEIIVIDFDFMSGDTNKDTVLLRAFDNINVNPNNSYVPEKTIDGRIFEIKTGVTGSKNTTPCLKLTDYFSKGSFKEGENPKGLDTVLGSFTYKANTWYSLRIQYTSSNNSITVYTKNEDGTYGKMDTVELGSGTPKGDIPSLNITSFACSTRGSDANVLGIDNISVLAPEEPVPVETATPEPSETATPEPSETATPEPGETATPEPSDESVIKFTQNGEDIDGFTDSEVVLTMTAAGEPCKLIAAGYDANGAVTAVSMTDYDPAAAETAVTAAITPTADTVTIRGYVWDGFENLTPMSASAEIKRK